MEPQTEHLFEIELERPTKGGRDATLTLYQQLLAAIISGRLPLGARLPPSRSSQRAFGVSRNTTMAVYDRLLHEGYVVARHGSGTHVASVLPGAAGPPPVAGDATPYAGLNTFWLRNEVTEAMGFWRSPADDAPGGPMPGAVDLRPAVVDSRLFPHDVFRRMLAKQLRGLERDPARYRSAQGNQGNFKLRAAIAQHIATTRAIVCQPDEVIVTSGAQQAFDLLARTLVGAPGAVVAVEDPGYPPMRVAFAAAGARLVGVPIDDEGLMVEKLPPDVDIICLCPSHQFPLGVPMSSERRKALIDFARRHGAVIVEDDYDGEFRHEETSLTALQALGPDVVFHVGTFSKCMLPALRLGFIIVPGWARPVLVAAKNCLDWHASVPVQAGVAAFIAEGHLTQHVRRMRQVYRDRRQLLLGTLKGQFAEHLAPIPSTYGMHVSAEFRRSIDAEAVSDALARQGVHMHALRRYAFQGPARSGLVFGYGVSDEAGLRRALGVLHAVLETGSPPSPSA